MTPRSKFGHRAAALLVSATFLYAGGACAQPRTFSEPTRLGTLEVTVFPQARLDDKEVRLAPGVRIRNESNLVVIPSTIPGKVAVRYRTDPTGQVIDAWILTEEEFGIAKDEARKSPNSR